jgi:CDP-diacylglycerol pyrophosphatase
MSDVALCHLYMSLQMQQQQQQQQQQQHVNISMSSGGINRQFLKQRLAVSTRWHGFVPV